MFASRIRKPAAVALCAMTLGAGLPAALAAQTKPPLWGEVILPGGAAAARETLEIGAADHRSEASWLLDAAHKYYDT